MTSYQTHGDGDSESYGDGDGDGFYLNYIVAKNISHEGKTRRLHFLKYQKENASI